MGNEKFCRCKAHTSEHLPLILRILQASQPVQWLKVILSWILIESGRPNKCCLGEPNLTEN